MYMQEDEQKTSSYIRIEDCQQGNSNSLREKIFHVDIKVKPKSQKYHRKKDLNLPVG